MRRRQTPADFPRIIVLLMAAGCTPLVTAQEPTLQTRAERTHFEETAPYAETMEFCHRLADASPWLEVRKFGDTPQNREMILIIASKEQAFTPEQARRTGKQVVLIQNCIHAGECAGKDASLMLLRDVAVTKERSALLDHAILVVVPIFNVDGFARFGPYNRVNQNGPREMGFRATAQRMNLNRDYLKAETVEMRALLAVWNAWDPVLHFDNHTTNGAEHQYDLMYSVACREDADPAIAQWVNERLLPNVLPKLEQDGHKPIEYFGIIDRFDVSKGIRIWASDPRYSTGYGAVRNRPSILVETHVSKPYRTRVMATYNIMAHALEELNLRPEALPAAIQQANERCAHWGVEYEHDRKLPLNYELTEDAEPFTFRGVESRSELSEVSGVPRIIYGDTPLDVPTKKFTTLRVTESVVPPLAYLIPPEWDHIGRTLDAHGIRYQRLAHPLTGTFESYRLVRESWAERPFEGHHLVTFTTEPIREERTYAAGSLLVKLDQAPAKIIVHLLEPQAPDSLAVWGHFDQLFAQIEYGEDYVLEELARKMMAEDPKLRAEFEQRLREDATFAADASARLWFFYRRSPWWDDRKNVYPLARVISPLWE